MTGQRISAGHVHPRRTALAALALIAAVLIAAAPAARAATTRGPATHTAARATRAAAALTPSAPLTRGSGYVALGDSVTFGYQEPGVSPTPDYHRASSFRGFPEQLGTALHLKVANFSCPGETSASLINAAARSLACENAYRRLFPLHEHYGGSQLDAALSYLRRHPGVRLVSLMIGANDLFLCQTITTDKCAGRAELEATEAGITRNVHRILSALRHRAHYAGQLVVVTYFSLDYASPATNAYVRALNQAQANGARGFHVQFADGYGELRTASRRFSDQPCLAGLLTQVGSYGNCGIHPSYAGQTLLAKAVATAARL